MSLTEEKTIIKWELWLYNSAIAISQTDKNSLCPQHFILLCPITIIINQRKVCGNWSCKIFYDVIRNFGFTHPKYFVKCPNKNMEKTLESLMPWTDLQFRHSRNCFVQLFWPKYSSIFKFFQPEDREGCGEHQKVSFQVKILIIISLAWQPDESENRDSHSSGWHRLRQGDTLSQVFPPNRALQTTWGGNGQCYVSFTKQNKRYLFIKTAPLFAPTFVWMSSVNCCDPRKYKKSSERDIATF